MRFSKTYFLAPWILAFWETLLQQYLPFTVLKLCTRYWSSPCDSQLQQYLPFTVLKLKSIDNLYLIIGGLQQYLPFTVLKHNRCRYSVTNIVSCNSTYRLRYWNAGIFTSNSSSLPVATVPTVYGIETSDNQKRSYHLMDHWSCNSTYRLRYWNSVSWSDPPWLILKVATVPTVYGIETGLKCSPFLVHSPRWNSTYRLRYWNTSSDSSSSSSSVATVPTVYGIET